MRFQNPLRPDALPLGLRYDAEKGYHECYEVTDGPDGSRQTGRRLGYVVDVEPLALEGIAPEEVALVTATVNGYVGAPDPDGPVYPRLVYPDARSETGPHPEGREQGAALDLVDLATGRPIWGVIDVDVVAPTNGAYALRFTFLAQGNDLGGVPLSPADCEPYRQESGALRVPHRDGVLVLGMAAVDELLATASA